MANLSVALFVFTLFLSKTNFSNAQCALNSQIVDEIKSYESTVKQITEKVVNGDFKGKLFHDTALFVDTVGARLVGSKALDDGIDYILSWMSELGFDNVHGEEIDRNLNWKRVSETLEMIEPRYQPLKISGYGSSESTPGPIEAEIIVVRNYTELEERASEVPGKIVVYEHKWVNYGVGIQFRNSGASEAAKRGAVAALVGAVSNIAMDLPRTGVMTYVTNVSVSRIPLASISVDAAEMLGRMHRRGTPIKLRLDMQYENAGMTKSRNTFGQLTGSTMLDETVIVSGHIDSWDVGQGAQDDGGAVVMSVLVISLLKSLGLTPRRTIQAVGWTSEENGLIGVQQYAQQHLEEIENGKIVAAIESDSGLFVPLGYNFAGSEEGGCIVKEILKLFDYMNFTRFEQHSSVGSDVSVLAELGVPTFDFITDNEQYFWYHHADSDTMSALDTDDLDKCLALYTASAYVLADLSRNLYRPVDTENPSSAVASTKLSLMTIMTVVLTILFKNNYTSIHPPNRSKCNKI